MRRVSTWFTCIFNNVFDKTLTKIVKVECDVKQVTMYLGEHKVRMDSTHARRLANFIIDNTKGSY